jgi:hypothetical protein
VIQCSHTRNDMPDSRIHREDFVLGALISLVKYQFGYGGYIENLDVAGGGAHITVHTPILGHYDIVTYMGSQTEMELLLQACYVYQELRRLVGTSPHKSVIARLAEAGGNTLIQTQLTPVLVGQGFARGVLLALLGEEQEPHREAIDRLSEDELATVAVLVHEGEPLADALALCA